MDPGAWGPSPPHTSHCPQGTQVSGRTVEVEVLADQRLGKDPQVTGDGSWSGVLDGQTEMSLWTPLQLLKQRQILCTQLGYGGTHQCSLAHETTYTSCTCSSCPPHASCTLCLSMCMHLMSHISSSCPACGCAHRDAQAECLQKSLPSHMCTHVHMDLQTHE